ncbi:flagella synthesis protein FlgN [Thauera chlorobenzoica]|uniref:Flagellar biosynthesis protein FlgN n=1 Tax=Thauera chlorobenzoica TaxID=96773 RepID=A0A1H5WAY7_9RHOO|nr:flagellar protein FlgN [Thauera chlorobenzoica]APR03226.1 Flagellar biosynthesis protein FlgN [Thauera chlorobenzoica]SEF96563.1 flagella synthesis protein FlgN [Thauera chlorobenzoica]
MSLQRLLVDQRQRVDALIALLEQEQRALAAEQVDGERIVELARAKQAVLEPLGRTETRRQAVQQHLGYGAGLDGALEAAREAGCEADWLALQERAAHAARLNALGGQLLQIRMRGNQRILDFIRELAEKTPYSADGQPGRRPGRVDVSA